MSFDDYLLQFKQWRRIADLESLTRQLEFRQRLMAPALSDLVRQAEQRERLFRRDFTRAMETQAKLLEEPLRQLTEQLDQQRRLLQPALAEFARDTVLQRELMESAVEHLSRAFREHKLLAQPLEEQFGATKELLQGLSSWADEIRQQVHLASDMQAQLRNLLATSASPVFRFVASEFERSVLDVERFAKFRQSFASEIIDYLGRIQVVEEEEDAEALAEELGDFFIRAAERLPKTTISLDALLQIFLAIVLFVWSHLTSMETEDRVLHELGSIEERIAKELESLREQEQQSESFVVTSSLRLRDGPSTEAAILAVLPAGMAVEVKSFQGEWLLIEYFDFVEGELRHGWVFERYLAAPPELSEYQMRSPRLARPEQAPDFVKEVLEDE